MARHVRLGVLVPSSNTALEPLTQAMLASIDNGDTTVSVHFSRFQVTRIDLSAQGLAQFTLTPIIAAAQLLADAKVDVIGWSGTSAGWLGFETDDKLCAAIQNETGIPATTSTLALNCALKLFGIADLGLVTPYIEAMNDAIIQNYAGIGVLIEKHHERHLGITDNNAICDVDEMTLDGMIESVVKDGAKAVTTFCTNLRAAQKVAQWEQRHGIILFDTVTIVVWDMLRLTGIDTGRVKGWGRLFVESALFKSHP